MLPANTNSQERSNISQDLEAIINLNTSRSPKEIGTIGAFPLLAGFIKKFNLVKLFNSHMTKEGYHHIRKVPFH